MATTGSSLGACWLDRWARAWRHRWTPEDASRRAVPDGLAERLRSRVAASEARHSGELVCCVEGALPVRDLLRVGREASLDEVVRERALAWFGRLRVWDTEHNNGVLIYLLLAERRLEIVADRGLSRRVDEAQWQALAQRLGGHLAQGEVEAGLTQALDEVSAWLERHFALDAGASNPNELPDAVVRV